MTTAQTFSDEIRLNGRDETAIPFEGAAAIVFHFSKTFTVQTDTRSGEKKGRAEAEVAARYNWFAVYGPFFLPLPRYPAPDSSLQYSEGSSVSGVSL